MKYNRVTEILYPFSGMKYVDAEVLENACVRGTKVHKACEAIVGGMDGWNMPEELNGYITSFRDWWGKGKDVVSVEERFHCDKFRITGQVDLIIREPEGCFIVDLKTSKAESKSWLLQGSAYSYLAKQKGYDVSSIMFLKLDRDGKPPRPYFYEEDFGLFKQTMNVWRYFYGKKDERNEVKNRSKRQGN